MAQALQPHLLHVSHPSVITTKGESQHEYLEAGACPLTNTSCCLLPERYTVIPLHQAILDEPDFIARDVTIQYLEDHPNLLG